MSTRFWKSLFFYKSPFFCCFIGFCLLTSVIFLIKGEEKPLSLKRDIFSEGQYLFSYQNKAVGTVDLNIIGGTVLEPFSPPFLVTGKVLGALGESEQRKEIEEYIVQSGDNLNSIAQSFGISTETLLWANDLTTNSILKPGQKLVILPVSGVLHIVREGDTLSEIAQTYKAVLNELIDFNDIGDGGRIYAGDFLIVPGGKKPKISQQYVQLPLSKSYFICPIPSPCRITQGLHWFNAVDFSNGVCGEPVFAVAEGKVQKTGSGSISGNYVRVLHPNGVVTFYGHLSKIAVQPDQNVYQGQILGYIGYSGLTKPAGPAGCHLHLDVRFAENPFSKYRVGAQLGK